MPFFLSIFKSQIMIFLFFFFFLIFLDLNMIHLLQMSGTQILFAHYLTEFKETKHESKKWRKKFLNSARLLSFFFSNIQISDHDFAFLFLDLKHDLPSLCPHQFIRKGKSVHQSTPIHTTGIRKFKQIDIYSSCLPLFEKIKL